MPNDEMSREEAERWLAELTANPDRMSAKMFQEGYEAFLRKSGLREAEISPLLRKARRAYDDLIEREVDDVVEDGMDDVEWKELEVLITNTNFDPEDRCRRDLCWNLFGAVSDLTRILDQAARSIGLSASLFIRVCHPSTLRIVI